MKTIIIEGATLEVNEDVPAEVCLPDVPNYTIPADSGVFQQLLVAWNHNLPTYIWGPAGCGKDAAVHHLSAVTRTPTLLVQIQPGADMRPLLFSQQFNKDGTFWEEGKLLKALRDGYTTPNGRVVPYAILLTDIDRADRQQAEMLRIILDSTEGRIPLWDGTIVPVLPGTKVFATANTSGSGDVDGRMVSASAMDASLLDRFMVFTNMDYLSESEEIALLKERFSEYYALYPASFVKIVKASNALRTSIKTGRVSLEFGTRALCNWVLYSYRLYMTYKAYLNPKGLTGDEAAKTSVELSLSRGFNVVLSRLDTVEARTHVERVLKVHLDVEKKAFPGTSEGKKS